MNMYTVGTVVEMAGFFEDLDGNRADPTFVRATIIIPDGTLINLTDGVQRRDTGDYFVLYVPPLSGLYQYRMIGYGAIAAANEGSWYAETSFPYDAINIPNTGEMDMPDGDAPLVNPTLSVFCTPDTAIMNMVGRVPGTGKYEVVPDQGELVLDGQAGVSDTLQSAAPGFGTLALAGAQVVVELGARTGTAAIGMQGIAPALTIVFNVVPLGGGLSLATSIPVFGGQQLITPNATLLALGPVPPVLNTTDNTQPGALALSGNAPVLLTNFIFGNTTTPGALVLTGVAPGVFFGQLDVTGTGSLAVSPAGASVVSITSPRNPNAGAVVFTGNAPVVNFTQSIAPGTGALALAGGSAQIGVVRQPLVGSIAFTGIAAVPVRGTVITPTVGSIVLAGVAGTAVASHGVVVPSVGSLSAVGVAPLINPFAIVGTPQRAQEGANAQAAVTLNVTAGNGLIAIVSYRNNLGGTFQNISVTGESNMLLAGGAEYVIPNTGESAVIAYLKNITASGSKTIQANWDVQVQGAGQIWVAEVTGQDTAAFLGQYTHNNGSSGNMTANVTTATDNELGLCFANNVNGEPVADTGGGWTDIPLINVNVFDDGQYKTNLGPQGSKTATMTISGGADWGMLFATFKAR